MQLLHNKHIDDIQIQFSQRTYPHPTKEFDIMTVLTQSTPNTTRKNRNLTDGTADISSTFEHGGRLFHSHNSHGLAGPKQKPTTFGKPRVLHIDDDVELLNAMWSRLRNSGFDSSSAINGIDGWKLAAAMKTDAIILDYDMPEMRGDSVLVSLKCAEETRHIPVVVLTAIGGYELKHRLLDLGADVVMYKPFNFDTLRSELERLISDSNSEGVGAV